MVAKVRQDRRALEAADRQRPQLSALDMAERGRQAAEDHREMAADDVVDRGIGAAKRHVRHLDPGHGREQRAGKMIAAADATGSVCQLAGFVLARFDQLAHGPGGYGGADHEDDGAPCDQSDRREVLARIISHIGKYRRRHRHRSGAAHDKRVSIRRAFGELARADRASGSGAVLDDDLLAQCAAHRFCEDAGDHVVAAAGRLRDDQGDRTHRDSPAARPMPPFATQTRQWRPRSSSIAA